MSNRPWHKFYHADFIASTIDMTVEEKGAYVIVLLKMYDRNGPVPNDDPQSIARLVGCSTRRWIQLRDRLIKLGKIYLTEEGLLFNARTKIELEKSSKDARELRENGAKGGRKTVENRTISAENNDLAQKGLDEKIKPNQIPDTRSQKLEKKEEESGITVLTSSPSTLADLRMSPRKARGSRMVEGWKPNQAGVALCQSLGLDPDQVADEFRDYWIGEGRTKVNWDATFSGRVRELSRSGRGARAAPPQGGLPLLGIVTGGKAPAPLLGDQPEAWFGLGDGQMLDKGTNTTHEYAGGYYIDIVAELVGEAAGFSRGWKGDWHTLVAWLRDLHGKLDSEQIAEIVRLQRERAREQPYSLKFFDQAVRQAAARKRSAA